MRIVRLQASNLLRLVAVDITPTGDVVTISGSNGSGKTSVLNSIAFALGGAALMKNTPQPIRDGQKSAEVTVDMGTFTVTRKWKGSESTLVVMSKDGAVYRSPQAFLNERLGALSFDPLAFTEQSPKEQVATLLNLVDVGFDPAELERQRQAIFEARTDAGRDLKRAEAQITDVPRPAGEPREEVELEDLLREHRQAQDAHDVATSLERQHHAAVQAVADAENALDLARSAVLRVEDAIKVLPDLPDLEEIERRMQALVITNREILAEHYAYDCWRTVDECKGLVASLTDDLIEIAEFKQAKLAEAKMPVEGLSFDEEGLLFNDLPFKQASAAEQLKVSVAMAVAANPQIKVIRIVDGSLLDSESMKVLESMAAEHDAQIWVERVSDPGQGVGFEVADGMVVSESETEEAHA